MKFQLACLSVVLAMCDSLALAQADANARRIQATVLGIDGHNDTVQHIIYDKVDIGTRLPTGMIDIPRLHEGGVHAPFFALWVPSYYKGSEAVRRTLDLRDAMQRMFDLHPDQIELATS